MKSTTKQPLNGNGLVQLIEVGNSIRLKRAKYDTAMGLGHKFSQH